MEDYKSKIDKSGPVVSSVPSVDDKPEDIAPPAKPASKVLPPEADTLSDWDVTGGKIKESD